MPAQKHDKSQPTRSVPRTRVLFVSQRQAEAMRPPRHAALISITDPTRQLATLQDGWQALLRVAFDDVDPITFPGRNKEMMAMSTSQAAEIAAFAASHSTNCNRFVIHCRHGISRSAAVAKAIAAATGASFPEDYSEYNRHVFQVVRKALAEA